LPVTFVVLFKTHFWDDFVDRQLERVRSRLGNGELFVVIDDSHMPVENVPNGNQIRISSDDFSKFNLAKITTHGSIIWYNIDYPNYIAFAQLPRFDYYISIEYDVVANIDLEKLVNQLSLNQIDYLGLPIKKPATEWPWYEMHKDIYGPEMLVSLSCFSVFSNRAMKMLFARRQEMSEDFLHGKIPFWPNNEAFIPNEILRSGMSRDSICNYGSTEHYDWWPPTDEVRSTISQDGAFIHPVLHGRRYTTSVLYHEPSLLQVFISGSGINERLKNLSTRQRIFLVAFEIRRRTVGRLYRALEQIGLRPVWFENAVSGRARFVQAETSHNAAK